MKAWRQLTHDSQTQRGSREQSCRVKKRSTPLIKRGKPVALPSFLCRQVVQWYNWLTSSRLLHSHSFIIAWQSQWSVCLKHNSFSDDDHYYIEEVRPRAWNRWRGRSSQKGWQLSLDFSNWFLFPLSCRLNNSIRW
jgi:hypothetical protein